MAIRENPRPQCTFPFIRQVEGLTITKFSSRLLVWTGLPLLIGMGTPCRVEDSRYLNSTAK
jgi:hypothetical protein